MATVTEVRPGPAPDLLEVRPPTGSPWLRRHARLAGLLAFVAPSFLWFARTWVDPVHRHAGLAGDPESYMFALAWPRFAVTHHLNPFFTRYVLTPGGANLMWSVPPGFGLLLYPLTATIGLVPTYNLLATLSLAASAWTAQLALRRFVPGELGPFVGGLFYGFSPYMAAHSTGHAMLTVAVLPPLLLLLLHELLVRQHWRPATTGVALGALVAFQISTFLELVAGGAVFAALLVCMLAIAYRHEVRARVAYVATALGAALVAVLVLAGYQLWTLLYGPQSLLHVHAVVHKPDTLVSDLLEFVVPTRYNVAGSAFSGTASHFTATFAEANAYIGLPLIAVVTWIVVKHRRSAIVRIAALMTVAMAVLSMGPRLHWLGRSTIALPWTWFARLPLMGHLLPVRLSVFTDLGVAFLLAYGIGHRAPRPSPRQRGVRTVATVAVVLSLLPSATLLDALSAPVVAPAYFTSSEVQRIPEGSVALVAPWTVDTRNDDPQLWQALAGFRYRMPSGYAYRPTRDGGVHTGIHDDLLENALHHITFGRGLTPDVSRPGVRAELARDLDQHDVRTVIVGPMPRQARMLRFLTALLWREPERSGGVYVWYDVRGDRSGPGASASWSCPPARKPKTGRSHLTVLSGSSMIAGKLTGVVCGWGGAAAREAQGAR
jgi:hypothetical protein